MKEPVFHSLLVGHCVPVFPSNCWVHPHTLLHLNVKIIGCTMLTSRLSRLSVHQAFQTILQHRSCSSSQSERQGILIILTTSLRKVHSLEFDYRIIFVSHYQLCSLLAFSVAHCGAQKDWCTSTTHQSTRAPPISTVEYLRARHLSFPRPS